MIEGAENSGGSVLKCWVCEGTKLKSAKASNLPENLESDAFAITNKAYGVTGEIHRCRQCGFLQCSNMNDVLSYYEDLEDPAYEESRDGRLAQAKDVVRLIQGYRSSGRLLDIGAGSGTLVEAAGEAGFVAEGVEPSRWLQQKAKKRGLAVSLGSFPTKDFAGPYDVITLIDVLEHVPHPFELMASIRAALSDDGILIIDTPDVKAVLPRLMGWRWWHFRVAHVGYFDRKTLRHLATRAGFLLSSVKRPRWYFGGGYLWDRLGVYMGPLLPKAAPRAIERRTIPLNLRDSMLAVLRPTTR